MTSALSIDLLHLDRPLTWDDLQVIPDQSHHHFELIEGQLLMSPSPIRRQQRCAGRLFPALTAAAADKFEVLQAPYDFNPEPRTVLQADVMVASWASGDEQRTVAPPLLVVEVISASSRTTDRVTKRELYAKFGVQHYWLVDPEVPEVLALQLDEGKYVEQASAAGSDEFQVSAPVEVTVVPAELVAD